MAGPSKVQFPGQKKQRMRARGTKRASEGVRKRLEKNLADLSIFAIFTISQNDIAKKRKHCENTSFPGKKLRSQRPGVTPHL